MSAPTLEKILQAVNEKYGTSFEEWSQLPTAYEVGDTIPNWNAYEKIEIIRFEDSQWYLIRLENAKYIGVLAYLDENSYSLGVNTTGGETAEPIIYNKEHERIGILDISDEQYEALSEKLTLYNGQSVYFEESYRYQDLPMSAKIINV